VTEYSELKARARDWYVVLFIAGTMCGGMVSSLVAKSELEAMRRDEPVRNLTIGDFNLVPEDYDGVVVDDPTLFVHRLEGGSIVAMMAGPDGIEPYHFQALKDDAVVADLDVEFSADRRIFERGLDERVIDAFERIRRNKKQRKDRVDENEGKDDKDGKDEKDGEGLREVLRQEG
jgi:hypothetical protein